MLWYYASLVSVNQAAAHVCTVLAHNSGCASYNISLCKQTLIEVCDNDNGENSVLQYIFGDQVAKIKAEETTSPWTELAARICGHC